MDPDFAQRRRVFVAAAVTVVAVPTAFLLGRGGSDPDAAPPTTMWSAVVAPGATTAPPASPAGDAAMAATEASSGANTILDVLGTTPVGYLGGTVAPDADDPPMIAVLPRRDTLTGSASFSEMIDRTTTCIIPQVAMGTEVTITNLDNSRRVKCQVVAVATPQATDVTMHVEAFSQIADITEAPVPVEISW